MAIVTRTIGALVDDISGLTALVSVDYDDQALRLTALRVDNPTSRAISATVIKQSNGRIYNAQFPAGENTFISIPSSQPADRVGVTLDANGRLVGVEYTLAWVV